MRNRLLCKYKFKFYLNASHYIVINGKRGEAHPHTWEFILDVVLPNNDIPPFDTIIPTLENLVEQFGEAIRARIQEAGGQLEQIEGSETPTRSYVISYTQDETYLTGSEQSAQSALSDIMDQALDEALE